MFVRVECLWDEGRRLEREVLAKRKMNCVSGELRLEIKKNECHATRPTFVARLLNGGFDSLSPLEDAAITWVYKDHMLITGLETDEVLQRTFAQHWRVEILELTTQQKAQVLVD
ncbi:hypothetical protein GN109_01470 [Collimonas pratensis]|uniref:hypothetical protein n=1 Tax=Collimonas pratensis TaxID=279113 RepID=UPI00143DFC81|nr:hypothetical protein [Collimonas pratensis]NKI68074.1 hypothetical protein [Collimonas pratensis]